MRASITAEQAGVPSVSIVCEGFAGQARATARGVGFDDLPVAVTTGHVDAQGVDEMERNFVTDTVAQIVAGLTGPGAGPSPGGAHVDVAGVAGVAASEPAATEVAVTGTIDEVNLEFLRRGWSDGLPVIPPTIDRVEAFIAASGHDPWKRLGIATTSGRDLTVWSIAVNAVMAGCDPAHLPVLLAVAEILADPHYGAEHSGNTTGADALMILDGPVVTELGFNHGQGALREGVPANTSVGRWLRLYLRNVFGFTADEHDKATFGNPARTVLAEDMAALADVGWAPLSADFGYTAADDAVTMARFNSGIIVGSVFGSSPEEILPYLGDGVARTAGWDLTHVHGLGQHQFRPLLVLSPVLARTFGRAGWSKDDVRRGLFEHARIPAWRFEKLIGQWSNLTAGRPTLSALAAAGHVPEVYARSDDPDRLVPVATSPDRFMIAVAGDPNRTNAYALSNDGPHGDYTTKGIDRSRATDLLCRI
ncbi:MAG: UGSC family (seleno)protein [Actinomycetota bacterium]